MSAAVRDLPQKKGPFDDPSNSSVSERTRSNSLFHKGSPDQSNKNAALDDGLDSDIVLCFEAKGKISQRNSQQNTPVID